jgi:hypothetical protein
VVVVPPIPADRYYTFEFLDAYTNDFAYIGTRATGSNGGTYLIVQLEWASPSRNDEDVVSNKPRMAYQQDTGQRTS